SFTFSTVGTFSYHCAIHPNMRGQVVVGSGSTFGNPTGGPGGPSGIPGPFYNTGDYQPGMYPPDYGNYPPGAYPPGSYPPYPGPGGPGNYQPTLTLVAPPSGTLLLSWVATPGAQMYRIYQTTPDQPLNFSVVQTINQLTGSLATNATVA